MVFFIGVTALCYVSFFMFNAAQLVGIFTAIFNDCYSSNVLPKESCIILVLKKNSGRNKLSETGCSYLG